LFSGAAVVGDIGKNELFVDVEEEFVDDTEGGFAVNEFIVLDQL
jgi:hypothetical protein